MPAALLKHAKNEERLLIALEHACKEGRLWQIERCLAEEKNPERIANKPFSGHAKITPLMTVCSAQHPEDPPRKLVRVLVDKYLAEVSAVDHYGRSALMHALMASNTEAAEELLRLRGDLTQVAKMGETALSYAAMSDNTTMLEWVWVLLGRETYRLDEQDLWGFTPLCHAAQGGELQAARWLLQRGADPSLGGHKDPRSHKSGQAKWHPKHRKTPTLLAAHEGHVDILALLYRRGGRLPDDVQIAPEAQTWLQAHRWQYPTPGDDSHESVLADFKRKDLAALHSSIRHGATENFDDIFEGKNFSHPREAMNAQDSTGRNAVLIAAAHHTGQTFQVMLEQLVDRYGGNLCTIDDAGRNVTMLAAEHPAEGALIAFKQLRSRSKLFDEHEWADGEDVNGCSAVGHCFGSPDEGVNEASVLQKVRFMLTGAATDEDGQGEPALWQSLSEALQKPVDSFGRRLIDVAAERGCGEIVQWVIRVWPLSPDELAATLNQHMLDGKSVLMFSAKSGDLKVCSALVDALADVNAVDDEGRDVRDYLFSSNNQSQAALTQWWEQVSLRASRQNQTPQKVDAVEIVSDPGTNGVSQSIISKESQPCSQTFDTSPAALPSTTLQHAKTFVKQPNVQHGVNLLRRVFVGKKVAKRIDAPQTEAKATDQVPERIEAEQSFVPHKPKRKKSRSPKNSPGASPRRKSNSPDGSPRKKHHRGIHKARKPTERWECERCGHLNIGRPGQKCTFCDGDLKHGETPADDSKKAGDSEKGETKHDDFFIVEDRGVEMRFVVEAPTQSADGAFAGKTHHHCHKVLNCYRAGKLRSLVKRFHLHWSNGVVEEFGYEYKAEEATVVKTKACFIVERERKQDVFKQLDLLASRGQAKVIYVGKQELATGAAG